MRSSRTFWGVAILIIGALLLLQNLGILNINVWAVLWPLLIILLGVQILWGLLRRTPDSERKNLSLPLTGIDESSITLEHGAGQIILDGRAQSGTLLSGEFSGGVRESVSQSGSISYINLKMPDDFFFPLPMAPSGSRLWKISLSPEIKLDLHLKTGASESTLDLSDLLIRSLRVDTGASSTRIIAPAHAGYSRMDLHSGAASINVNIPPGVSGRIEVKGGLSSNNIDRNRFPQSGSIYQSPDYESALNRVDIKVETGVGSVEIN